MMLRHAGSRRAFRSGDSGKYAKHHSVIVRAARIGVLLAFSCVATAAAETDFDRIARDFAYAFTAHAISAFAPLAAGSPADGSWDNVASTFIGTECITISGYRMRVARQSPTEATLIVDVDGRVTIPASQKTIALKTPWTLFLVRTQDSWKIRGARVTAALLAQQFIETGRAPDECDGVDMVAPSFLAYSFANRASQWYRTWDHNEAAIDYAQAMARGIGDAAMVAFCDAARSRLAWNQHDYPRALQWAEKALPEARASGDPDTIGASLLFIGMAEFQQDQSAKAFAHLDEGASLIDQVENTRVALVCATYAAYAHVAQHDYRAAITAAHRGLELSRKYGWPEGQTATLQDLGAVHVALRDYAVARKYFAEEVAVMGGREVDAAQALSCLAETELELGDVAHATEHLQRALAVSDSLIDFTVVYIRQTFASLLTRLGRPEEAEKQLSLAIDLARHAKEGGCVVDGLTEMSVLRRRSGHYEDALRYAREAMTVEMPKGTHARPELWRAKTAMGQALRKLGRTAEAIEALYAAIDEIESQRTAVAANARQTSRFLAQREEPYQALLEILVRRGSAVEALRVAERMRGAQLVEEVDRQEPLAALRPEERKREEDLEANVVAINKALLAARARGDDARVRALRGDLERARVELDGFDAESGVVHAATRARHAGVGDFEPELPERLAHTAVLQYVVTEEATIIFTMRGRGAKTRIGVRSLPIGRTQLAQRINAFCTKLASRDLSYAVSARRLYAQLVAPVEPLLRDAHSIAIIPDAELWRLPFHALVGRDGRYLVEHYGVFYAPSMSMLLKADGRRPDPRRGKLLAYGNPVVSHAAAAELRDVDRAGILRPLPDAEREVKSIAALYGAEHSRVRIRAEASEGTFKKEAPQYDVLHLATHGFFDDQSPMYSALVLAAAPDDPAEDGLLETREILQLRLNARMAVLAACNTGRGATDPGAGVIGVSWAFLVAGCPTTVVTQWNASSAASSSLMIAFHRRLAAGDSNAEALRRAQLTIRRDPRFHHPFYWASFIVVGAP